MLSFLRKRVIGSSSKGKSQIPVLATAVATPLPILSREVNGRNVKKGIDTSIVYNQFEQLRKFQHLNNLSNSSISADHVKRPKKETNSFPQLQLLVLVALISAVTASIVVLMYSTLFWNTSTPICPNLVIKQQVPSVKVLNQLNYQEQSRNDPWGHSHPNYQSFNELIPTRKKENIQMTTYTKKVFLLPSPAVEIKPKVHFALLSKQIFTNAAKLVAEILKAPMELKYEVEFNYH